MTIEKLPTDVNGTVIDLGTLIAWASGSPSPKLRIARVKSIEYVSGGAPKLTLGPDENPRNYHHPGDQAPRFPRRDNRVVVLEQPSELTQSPLDFHGRPIALGAQVAFSPYTNSGLVPGKVVGITYVLGGLVTLKVEHQRRIRSYRRARRLGLNCGDVYTTTMWVVPNLVVT